MEAGMTAPAQNKNRRPSEGWGPRFSSTNPAEKWMPAFAGMTTSELRDIEHD
jgi:hypothetical protein